ncbi:MAG: DsbA family protein [Chloroflexota bacterium]
MENNPETTGSGRKRQGSKESPSRRQSRRDEIRRKERTQRTITVAVIGVVALAVIFLFIVPAFRSAGGGSVPPFTTVEPVNYANANGFQMGDANAKVKIEVFEDYTCSACKVYSETVEPQVISEIVDKGLASYVFYQFPFLDDGSQLKQSDLSANAALCAADQNKFWDYKKILFINQGLTLTEPTLNAFAESVGLDTAAFKSCFDARQHQGTIDEHLALGESYNVSGTPSVFVNGVEVAPGRVPSFQQIFDAVNAAQNQ